MELMQESPLQQFISNLEESLHNDAFIKLSLGDYKGTEKELKNIYIRKILIKKQDMLQFTYRYKTRDIVKNFAIEDAFISIKSYIGSGFGAASLFTSSSDIFLQLLPNGKLKLTKKEPSHSKPESLAHNREKHHLIYSTSAYLQDLKICDAKGNIFKNSENKFRQINKYVEILSSLIKQLPNNDGLKIADMGSGKGYLTFALYDYLNANSYTGLKVTGVEFRQDMVELCNKIAQKHNMSGLSFIKGSIDNYNCTDNIVIALHACDTATDDSICKAINAGAELIVTSPCCHKQIRQQIEDSKQNNELDFITRYGILKERQCEMVTDGLRALIMEYYGYKTNIFEFISESHTPKNIMITAIKSGITEAKKQDVLEKIKQTKEYFGIRQHYLEKAMGMKE